MMVGRPTGVVIDSKARNFVDDSTNRSISNIQSNPDKMLVAQGAFDAARTNGVKRVVVQDVRCPDGINVGQEQHGADPSDCLEMAFAALAKGILPRNCMVHKRSRAAFCGAGNDILQRGRKSESPLRARVCAEVCAYPRFARAQSETYVLSVIGGRKIGSNIATLNAMEDLQNRAIRLQEDICLAFGTVGEVE